MRLAEAGPRNAVRMTKRPSSAGASSSGAFRAGTRNGSQNADRAASPWPSRSSQAARVRPAGPAPSEGPPAASSARATWSRPSQPRKRCASSAGSRWPGDGRRPARSRTEPRPRAKIRTSNRGWRKRSSSIPTSRTRPNHWSKQPRNTCWPVSRSAPPASKEAALPPTRRDRSKISTSRPRRRSSSPAASPASPAPTTATRGTEGDLHERFGGQVGRGEGGD